MGTIDASGRGNRNDKDETIHARPRPPLKVYEGTRRGTVCHVVVGELNAAGELVQQLSLLPRTDLFNHSEGFEWGYGGAGPSQLALALCAHALGNDARALGVYQHFKWQHVAKFPQAGWRLTDEQIAYDVDQLESMAERSK